jgi:hypothetical protein
LTVASAAVAVAPCPPDLVLPPGFDRIGETRAVENLAAPGAGERFESNRPHGMGPDRVAVLKDLVASGRYVPFAGLRREFAKSGPEASSAEPRRSSYTDHAPAVAGQEPALTIEQQLGGLREATAARIRRYLSSRGTSRDFARAEGVHEMTWYHQLHRVHRRGGPLAAAITERKEGHGCLTSADVVACTRCGLRGHVAGDPDRCYQQISLGLGGSQLRGQ